MTDRAVGVTDQASGAGVADVRARERVISATTYAEQYVIPIRERVLSGVYLTSFLGTVQATAHTPPAGYWWLINPVGSTVSVALRRAEFMSQHGSALATVTSPRETLRLVTFTGTASGAQVTPAKALSSYAAATATFRTANTGLTLTQGADFFSFFPSSALTAAGCTAATAADWNPEDEGMIVLGAGEGIYCYQQDAGTASDTRRWVMNLAWEEYTLP